MGRGSVTAWVSQAIAGLLADAEVAPATQTAQKPAKPSTRLSNESLTKLEAERARLAHEIEAERLKIENVDPLFLEAEKRRRNISLDTRAVQDARIWVFQHAKREEIAPNSARIFAIYRLQAVSKMLSAADTATMMKYAVIGTSRLKRDQLADDLAHHISGINRNELDDPKTLWNVIQTKLPGAVTELNSKAAKRPKDLGWPTRVVKWIGADEVHGLHETIYSSYITAHRSERMIALQKQYRDVQQQLSENGR
jgi:hypothetical protein